MTRSLPLLVALLGACTGGSGGGATCSTDQRSDVAVLQQISFVRQADGISDGFDLDGAVSTAGGATGCGVADWTDPDGVPGIDNSFATLIPALEQTEAVAVEGLIQSSINDGNLLLMFELGGVDDRTDDDCVSFEFLRGDGVPLLGTDQLLEVDQTIAQHPTAPTYAFADLAIAGGTLNAGPMAIDIPVHIFGLDLDFILNDAQMRVHLRDDGTYEGFFAGGVDTQTILDVAANENVDAALYGILVALFANTKDLAPDAGGACTQISLGFQFKAVPAFLLDESAQ